jgi:D-glycero-D-manno-heptose 1,7-bisphosphate phosphatase
MTKLIIFDKDGTLTEPISGNTFVQHPHDQRLRPGVAEKLEQLRGEGWVMAIASNQGGVAAGHKTLDEAIEEMKYALSLTGIYDGYMCPDNGDSMISCGFSDANFRHVAETVQSLKDAYDVEVDGFRKPHAGMLLYRKHLMVMNPTQCLMVGDRPEDQAAAEAAGFAFEWAVDFFGGGPISFLGK